MWKKLSATALVVIIIFVAAPLSATAGDPFVVDVFFRNYGMEECSHCADVDIPLERTIRISVRRVFSQGIDNGQIVFNYFNLYENEEYSAMLSERAYLAGVDAESIGRSPAFFTQDNHYFSGDDAIINLLVHTESLGITIERVTRDIPHMPEGTVISPRHDDPYNISVTDSVVVYFYTPWCPFCYQIAPIMDNLPEYVIINGQRSNVRLISYNRDIPEHHDIIWDYHEMLNIPEARRFVPLVLIGDRNLFLYNEVSTYLLPALEAGEGLTTPLFTERQPDLEQTGAITHWVILFIIIGATIVFARYLLLRRRIIRGSRENPYEIFTQY